MDALAWAAKNGHSMLELVPEGPGYAARFRKGGSDIAAGGPAARLKDKKSFVLFSGEFDRVLASFILPNAAASMGDEVSMFFTFWGLNALRRDDPPPPGQKWLVGGRGSRSCVDQCSPLPGRAGR